MYRYVFYTGTETDVPVRVNVNEHFMSIVVSMTIQCVYVVKQVKCSTSSPFLILLAVCCDVRLGVDFHFFHRRGRPPLNLVKKKLQMKTSTLIDAATFSYEEKQEEFLLNHW